MIYKICPKNLLTLTLSFLPLQADTPANSPAPLPSILPHPSQQTYQAQSILNVFKDYILTFDIDKKSVALDGVSPQYEKLPEGLDGLLQKIQYFTNQHRPLVLTMVGFPYKSSNVRDKVLAMKADGAERYALRYLQDFLSRIKTIYPPGAKLILFTDGVVFCDLEKVSDETVMRYEDDLKTLANDLPDIDIRTMRDLCPGKTPVDIRALVTEEKPSFTDFKDMFTSDGKIKDDVHVLTKRMAFELALFQLSDQELFDIGLKETHRSLQYSQFLKKFRPENTITFSVHYQKNVSKKVGLKLSNSYVTPWHGALVETETGPTISHLNAIDLSLYEPTTKVVNGLTLSFFTRRR